MPRSSLFDRTVADIRSRLALLGHPCIVEVLQKDPGPDALATFGIATISSAPIIEVTPGLRGCQLWRVLLHEFGHALGLGHSRTGIMAPNSSRLDWDEREPTERQKHKWALEIARAIEQRRATQLCGYLK